MDTSEYAKNSDDRRVAKRVTRHPAYQHIRKRAAAAEQERDRLSKTLKQRESELDSTKSALELARNDLTSANEEIEGLQQRIEELENPDEGKTEEKNA